MALNSALVSTYRSPSVANTSAISQVQWHTAYLVGIGAYKVLHAMTEDDAVLRRVRPTALMMSIRLSPQSLTRGLRHV